MTYLSQVVYKHQNNVEIVLYQLVSIQNSSRHKIRFNILINGE